MKLKGFIKVPLLDQLLEALQTNIETAFTELFSLPILSGRHIELTTAPGVDLVVNHRLGRKPKGYPIVGADADVRVWRSPTPNPMPDKQLILRASGSASITLHVY